MGKNVLYSIGHGTRRAEDFLALLQHFEIAYLIDVRSIPFSKFNPQYRQDNLKLFLESNGIRYVYMGDALGGRPKDPSCYNSEGKIDYDIVRTKDFFKQGVARLQKAYEADLNAAIMCSETKPSQCHRCRLIGRTLSEKDIILQHIDEHGELKNQVTVMNGIRKGHVETSLFNTPF